jgi:hypothetical protein
MDDDPLVRTIAALPKSSQWDKKWRISFAVANEEEVHHRVVPPKLPDRILLLKYRCMEVGFRAHVTHKLTYFNVDLFEK